MRISIIIILAAFLLVLGCSHGGKSPVAPEQKTGIDQSDGLPVLGLSESGDSSNAIGMLGEYELILNAKEMTAEIVAKRGSALGQSYLVSGKSYFAMNPCATCLKISGIALKTDGNIELKFSAKHPFDLGDPHKPPSGANRSDLDIFDTALVVKPVGVTPKSFSQTKADIYDDYCVSPDGYTRELENLTGDATACPYYLVVDDSRTGSLTYNVFTQSSSKSFSAFFNPNASSGTMTFDLYLTFGYGLSAVLADRLHPTYFNPEFNRKAAWKVQATPPQGNAHPQLGNTWQENDPDTAYKVKVKIWDWQEEVAQVANPPINPSDVAISSIVESVSAEVPGMCDELPVVTSPVKGSGSNPRDPLIYEIPIFNKKYLGPGEYLGLVKVTDERKPPVLEWPGQIDTLVDNPDGLTLDWYSINEYATYATFIATVVEEPCLASGVIAVPGDFDEFNATSGVPVDFTVNVTPSGHNVLLKYWADWGTGNYTESNTTGVFQHTFVDLDCPASADDIYPVKFGTELDCTDGGIIFIDSINIKLTCAPCNATGGIVSPTGTRQDVMNGETIDFTLDATPNGGVVTSFWADWGTGTYTESSPTPNFSHQFVDTENCPPYNDPPPQVGNISIATNRVYSGLGVVLDATRPFTVNWSPPAGNQPNAVFTVKFGVELDCWPGNINNIGTYTVYVKSCFDYVIYRDIDPSDGLTNNLEEISTVKTNAWVAPADHINVNGSHYVEGATYVVYSKNVAGDLSGLPSEPAHLIVAGAETSTALQPFNSEGWTSHNRSGNTASYRYQPFTNGSFPAAGLYSIRFGDMIGQSGPGTWEGISRATPTVPNSSVRFLEFSGYKYRPG